MQIKYKNTKIEKVCSNASKAEKTYGERIAEKIQMRIDQIKASDTIDYLINYRIGRCHSLTGDRDGQYAMDLVHPLRLIFTVDKSSCIQVAEIVDITDYH